MAISSAATAAASQPACGARSCDIAEISDGQPPDDFIWGALTDEMDAPGRGSPEQDAAAVRHMKQAAAEWLTVVDSPQNSS